ncbi:hypothetical protein WJT74_05225 [Sphingomicrobium sp. XHP0239]|uniref:hypothetical protein n=1 Tax=Sphingomicrobium maritimum TaxID=3133972 RepID=UPI0031CCC6E7
MTIFSTIGDKLRQRWAELSLNSMRLGLGAVVLLLYVFLDAGALLQLALFLIENPAAQKVGGLAASIGTYEVIRWARFSRQQKVTVQADGRVIRAEGVEL